MDEARQLLEDYRKTLKKGKRTIATDESGDLPDRIDRTENMLDRVEQIEVIDSIVVDSEDFFSHFRLSAESGSINPPDVLPANFSAAHPTIVYEPESGRQMIWAAPDNEGVFKLMSSSLLYGDDWEKPAPLGDDLGEGGDANYPFLMPDGITLYFANDGENSLGGLDIFISRRNEDGFLQPQNIGMPYNSPYDDYMFAIDELTGVGWWATDRNRIPGKVTIYVFIPSELRKNVDPDNPDISRLARLSSIKDTWKPTTNRNEILRRIAAVKSGGHNIPKNSLKSSFREEASTPPSTISANLRHGRQCSHTSPHGSRWPMLKTNSPQCGRNIPVATTITLNSSARPKNSSPKQKGCLPDCATPSSAPNNKLSSEQ